jgi:hypothetical protein
MVEGKVDIAKTLSNRMRIALIKLSTSEQPVTCTSVGSLLTGRKSAYGWQTSAREGGRTLRALERRKLACSQEYDSFQKIWPWTITPLGKRVAMSLTVTPRVPETVSRSTVPQSCSHCGAKLDGEDRELIARHGPLACPRCNREGCDGCMPFGRGVICPECEELREGVPELG